MRRLNILTALAFAHDLDAALDDFSIKNKDTPRPEVAPVTYEKVPYKKPAVTCPKDDVTLCDPFDTLGEWSVLKDTGKYDGKWELKSHEWLTGDSQLTMTEGMHYYGLTRALKKPWSNDRPIHFSMTARFAEDHVCGGAYVKLYEDTQPLSGDTPYSIMFGPDRCGIVTRKVHFIIQYQDAAGNTIEEVPTKNVELPPDMRQTHQYGFSLTPEGELEIFVDNTSVLRGPLRELTQPGWKSPTTIDDPSDVQPADWVPPPRMIPDEQAVKPEDWDETEPETIEEIDAVMPEDWLEDEPAEVPNMDASKPEDWDDAEDGVWQRPMKKNPKCQLASGCGKWSKPMIPNPAYRGPWKPPMIPNPDYTEKYPSRQIPHPAPYDIKDPITVVRPFNSIGFELWTVQGGTAIDNLFIGADPMLMKKWAEETFEQIRLVETENYRKRTESDQEKTAPESEKDRTQRYIKIGSVGLLASVVLTIALRKILAPSFKQSDLPPVVAPDASESEPAAAEAAEPAEEAAADLKENVSDAKGDTKHGTTENMPEEIATEPSAGETKPTKRN